MKRICAWCGKGITQEEGGPESDRVITHGICAPCQSNLSFQRGVSFQKFIDSLEAPVLVVDSEDRIDTVNLKAREILGKELSDIQGSKPGDVFECAYARRPEGCGKTTHCSGCAIRRTVGHTFESGESSLRVPATLRCRKTETDKDTLLFVSTEKVGNFVLLRVDEEDKE